MTQKHYTTEPDNIDVPEWAREYDVGDTLCCTFEGSEYDFTLLGWSTADRNEGRPVIPTAEIEAKTGKDIPKMMGYDNHTVAVKKESVFKQ